MVQVTTQRGYQPSFPVQAQPISPSFFRSTADRTLSPSTLDGSLIGPRQSLSRLGHPATPGEMVLLYANGFGQTSTPVVSGANTQTGTLRHCRSLRSEAWRRRSSLRDWFLPRLFQFNVVIPPVLRAAITRWWRPTDGAEAAPAALITVQGSSPAPSSVTYYVAPTATISGAARLAAPNASDTDGPFATFDTAARWCKSIVKAGTQSGDRAVPRRDYTSSPRPRCSLRPIRARRRHRLCIAIIPGESPAISGGMRVRTGRILAATPGRLTLPALRSISRTFFITAYAAPATPRRFTRNVLPICWPGLFECAGTTRQYSGSELFGLFSGQRLGMLRPLPIHRG